MGAYRLTRKADEDLARLYRYGMETFGIDRADRYFDSLIARLEEIADTPRQFQETDYREGYQRAGRDCPHPAGAGPTRGIVSARMTEQPFNPEHHGFRKLALEGPGDLVWFEKCAPGLDLEGCDPLRLNVYLTRDHDYTTIWFGFIDSAMAEMKLGFVDDPGINFSEMYEQTYFRGDIQNDAFGRQVLQAIRIERIVPNAMRLNDNKQLECCSLVISDR